MKRVYKGQTSKEDTSIWSKGLLTPFEGAQLEYMLSGDLLGTLFFDLVNSFINS